MGGSAILRPRAPMAGVGHLMSGSATIEKGACSHRKPAFTKEDLERRKEIFRSEEAKIFEVILNKGKALNNHAELRERDGLAVFGDCLVTYSRDRDAEKALNVR